MSQLILIRHSQTKQEAEVSSHIWQLTTTGRERCDSLAKKLRPYAIDRIVTSEEPKAYLTGKLVADVLGIPCGTASDLHETRRDTVTYFDTVTDFEAAVQAAMAQPDQLLFGEETFTDAHERFAHQINILLQQYPDDTLAIVTHGTVMSLYLGQISDRNVVDIWKSLDMPAFAVVSLPQKTMTQLVTTVVGSDEHGDNSESD